MQSQSDIPRLIDCHNHMLPDIDDGATSMAMSLQMAKTSVDCGVSDIVVTPHHGNGAFSNFKESVLEQLTGLQIELYKHKLPLKLHVGSELHLTTDLVKQLQDGEVFTYADKGKAALIELPKHRLPIGVEAILGGCIDLGITPIIAHPERNSDLAKEPEILEEWAQWGCKSQITALSITGKFGEPLQRVSEHWIRKGCVHIVASDAHRPEGRSPNLMPAYERLCIKFGEEIAQLLLYQNPQRLLHGEALQSPKVVQDYLSEEDQHQSKSKKKWFFSRLFSKK